MQISVTFRHLDSSDALREYATSKIDRLAKFWDGIVDAHVVLEKEKTRHIARVTVNAAGSTIRAEESSPDMYASIDLVADKVYRQLKKHHDKRKRVPQKKRASHPREMGRAAAGAEREATVQVLDAAGGERRIVGRKTFPMKPMFVDDAILELDRSGLQFYVFLNAETDEVNVVYNRPDGNLGLIEPAGR